MLKTMVKSLSARNFKKKFTLEYGFKVKDSFGSYNVINCQNKVLWGTIILVPSKVNIRRKKEMFFISRFKTMKNLLAQRESNIVYYLIDQNQKMMLKNHCTIDNYSVSLILCY